jgi:GNAT superfamily N-acetyltransferase
MAESQRSPIGRRQVTTPPIVRRASAEDDEAILGLGRDALGWDDDDRHGPFFHWKHRENPFGESPSWVATVGDRVVAFRTFLRWEWRRPNHNVVRAVRAVDTATHPEFQGQGLFRALTLNALDELADEGVRFVFNTPNDNSRPGYLKMGWQVIGRPSVRVRPHGLRSLLRMSQARVSAAKWSEPASFGRSPQEAFADDDEIRGVLASAAPEPLTTNRTPAYLRWRFGFGPLHYRVVSLGDVLTDGFAVVRLRRRGAAVEGTVCELHTPPGDHRAGRGLLSQVEGADYLLVAGSALGIRSGLLPAPRQGPIVTWRAVGEHDPPALDRWHLTMGDLELF